MHVPRPDPRLLRRAIVTECDNVRRRAVAGALDILLQAFLDGRKEFGPVTGKHRVVLCDIYALHDDAPAALRRFLVLLLAVLGPPPPIQREIILGESSIDNKTNEGLTHPQEYVS